MASSSRPTSRGFGPGNTPRPKHNGFVCPLIGAPKPLPLSYGTAASKNTNIKLQNAWGNDGKEDSGRPRSQGVLLSSRVRSNDAFSVQSREIRPRTQGSSRRKHIADSAFDSASAAVYGSILDVDAWVSRGKEMVQHAENLACPSALLTAIACDTASKLAPTALPQHSVISSLIPYIDTSVYCTDDDRSVSQSSQETRASRRSLERVSVRGRIPDEVPQKYKDRVPYFLVTRRQAANLARLRKQNAYLTNIIKQSTNLKRMAPQLCAMTWVGIKKASCVWLFAFWRLFVIDIKALKRKRAEMLAQTVAGDCLHPFMYWRMYVVEQSAASLSQTRDCFKLERRMLSVQVKDLEEQRMDVKQKLRDSCENTQRLKERLETEVREREALVQRLESTHPELVRGMLCAVLNVIVGVALRDAKVNRVITRRSLATKELAVLLTHDEESVQKLLKVPGDSILLRWVNYHLMQGRLVATEIFESIARARSEETNPTGNVTEWSARDADIFSDRCREVRSLHRIFDLSSDLSDSKVLTVVYASLASASHGQGTLNPAALWPLDERDAEARAAKLCEAIRLILPTRTAQYLLKHLDISRGNSSVLTVVLATLFLHNSALPNSLPEPEFFAYITAPNQEVGVDFASDQEAKPPSETSAGSRSHSPDEFEEDHRKSDSETEEKDEHKAAKQDETLKHVLSVAEQTASSCAYDSLQDFETILRGNEVSSDLLRMPLVDLLLRWLNLKLEKEGKSKVTSLSELKGGKILFELLNRVAHDVFVLLPEAKPLLDHSKQGIKESEKESADKEKHDKHAAEANALRVQVVLECGSRCTSFDILTKEAVDDGQSDLLAAFLAGLFLSRPSLPISARSSLRKHIDHIEECVRQGSTSQKPELGKDAGVGFANLCVWLKDKKDSMEEAMEAVQKARDLQAAVEQRLNSFIGNLLARRARGVPWKLADEEEVHDPKKLALLSSARLGAVVMRETHQLTGSTFKDNVNLVDDLLRKHARLFREMFLHYALPRNGETVAPTKSSKRGSMNSSNRFSTGFGMDGKVAKRIVDQDYESSMFDLQGAMRIYKDCRLRTYKFLPRDVEDIYNEVKVEAEAEASASSPRSAKGDDSSPSLVSAKSPRNRKGDKHSDKEKAHASPRARIKQKETRAGLSLEDFIEVMILMSCRSQITGTGFGEQFAAFIDKRLWPLACRSNEDFFYKMSHDVGVRMTLLKHDKALRSVFTTYASSGVLSDSGKLPSSPKGKLPRLLHVDRFETVLSDAGMVRGQMTGAVLREILTGVMESFALDSESETESENSSQSSKSHEEKNLGDGMISYPEFTNALIAVVLHLDPNPFITFSTRFERFIKDRFLKALKTHWQERSPDAGLGKTLESLLNDHPPSGSPRAVGRQSKASAGGGLSDKPEKPSSRGSEAGKKVGRNRDAP